MPTQNLAQLSKEAIEHNNIVDGKFDGTIAKIQNLIGAESGDVAGIFFAGKEVEWTKMPLEDRLDLVQNYIESEITDTLNLV
jgi:hypothetical protein